MLFIASIALLALIIMFYTALVVLSPPTIHYTPEECFFVTPEAPDKQIPLPTIQEPATIDLSVVIPAYNEFLRLPPMLAVTFAHLSSHPSRSFEVIIVDDGSTDSTVVAALSFARSQLTTLEASHIRVIKLAKNRGKGAAVKFGFLHARGERILMVDADGASRFEDLELLSKEMDRIESSGHGVAIGSRAHLVGTDAVVKRSFIRNFLMHGLHLCLRTLGVGHVRDTQCGFKLFTRETARQLFPTMHIPHWIFDVELLLVARMLDLPLAEVPIAWHEVEGSKVNLARDSIGMLRDLILLRANYATGRWKIEQISQAKKSQ